MKLLSKLKELGKAKKALFYIVCLSLFLYTFSVPSFGETGALRIIVYGSMFLLGITAGLYIFLYGDFKVNISAMLVPLFCTISLFGTIFYSHQFRSWLSLVLLSISFFIFIYAFKVLKNKYLVASIIALAFFSFSLYYIFHYRSDILAFRSFASGSFRLGWDFDNPNGVSAYAIVGIAVALYMLLFWNNKFRFCFIFPILSSLLVGFTTGSRTFIVALFIVLLAFLFIKFSHRKLIYFCVVAGIILLGVILINLPFLSTLKDRLILAIGTFFGTGTKVDTSTISRAVMIDYGFYLGSKRLIFGYGVGGFGIASGIGTYAHSNFAEVLCDFGLSGLIVFYAPLVIFLIKSFLNPKVDKAFIVSFVLYYLLVSFSNVLYYKKIYYMILAFMFYLVYIEPLELKTKRLVDNINKIVFVCDSMGSGGAEKVIASLSNQFHRNGVYVTVIGVADLQEPKSFYALEKGVRYITPANGSGVRIRPLKRLALLRKMILELHPDVVISFLPNANIYTWLSLLRTKIPYIVSERNNPYIDPKGKIERILKLLSFYFADGCVFQTGEAMGYYPASFIKKSAVIKNPIVIPVSKRKTMSHRNKVVLAVGRLSKQKNYRCLLDAFKAFNERKSGAYLLKIYGDGPLKGELMEYSTQLGIKDCVVFAGNDNKWHPREYNDALYVLSSDYEGMPNSLAEAMLLGIPSISTDCPTGGSRELINDGVNGYLVPVGDSEELYKKMLEVIEEDPSKFYNATRNMAVDFSIETISNKWIAFIRGLTKDVYE